MCAGSDQVWQRGNVAFRGFQHQPNAALAAHTRNLSHVGPSTTGPASSQVQLGDNESQPEQAQAQFGGHQAQPGDAQTPSGDCAAQLGATQAQVGVSQDRNGSEPLMTPCQAEFTTGEDRSDDSRCARSRLNCVGDRSGGLSHATPSFISPRDEEEQLRGDLRVDRPPHEVGLVVILLTWADAQAALHEVTLGPHCRSLLSRHPGLVPASGLSIGLVTNKGNSCKQNCSAFA